MMRKPLAIIRSDYFDDYKNSVRINVRKSFERIRKIIIKPDTFTFYTSVSVATSSRIEGEPVEIDTYVKHKLYKKRYLPGLLQKPNDLYEAYIFAQKKSLNLLTFLEVHKKISAHLLPVSLRGRIRVNPMVIVNEKGQIQYEAAPPSLVNNETQKLFSDIRTLVKSKLSVEEIFYYASFIHLVFVKIHPFEDGNGRAGRLLEKWFLAECLGKMAWCIESEKHYYRHLKKYYHNLARLGFSYEGLNYDKCIPFLLMLPCALKYTDVE
ncbi:MAG: Fic family protein [Bacteroidetes bacterium]|nr:Fic family protein [Bacteroidota bacterium]